MYVQARIMSHAMGSSFDVLMTLYLTDFTTPEEIIRSFESGSVYAAKLYPAGINVYISFIYIHIVSTYMLIYI
jgi:dihydroorotase